MKPWGGAAVKKLNSRVGNSPVDEDRQKRWSEMGNQKQQTLKKAANKQKKKQTKIAKRLANPDIKLWYDNLARSSPTTAGPRLRKLGQFCELHQMTPMELAELGMKDVRVVSDLLQDHITWMEEQGKAPQYIKAVMTSTKSWLAHFDISITRRLRIANVDSTPTLENERVPQADEMAEVMSRSDLFAGAAISLIAKAGLRPETLGNHDGTDGLKMKDMPDIVIQQGVARVLQTPPMIVV